MLLNRRVAVSSLVAFVARGTGHEYLLLSPTWHEKTIYRASDVKLFLCRHGKASEAGIPGRDSLSTGSLRTVTFYANVSWLLRLGPWPCAEAVTLLKYKVKFRSHSGGWILHLLPMEIVKIQVKLSSAAAHTAAQ